MNDKYERIRDKVIERVCWGGPNSKTPFSVLWTHGIRDQYVKLIDDLDTEIRRRSFHHLTNRDVIGLRESIDIIVWYQYKYIMHNSVHEAVDGVPGE